MLCATAGVPMAATPLDGGATAHQVVRTFSRADAPGPPEPQGVRANCCARIAGPAMGFVELLTGPAPGRGRHRGLDRHVALPAMPARAAGCPCASPSTPATLRPLPRANVVGGRHAGWHQALGLQQVPARWTLAALLPGPPQLEHSRQLSTQRPSAGSVARAPVSQLRPAQPLTAFSSGPLTCRCGPPRIRACMCRCCWTLLASWPRKRATPGIPILPLRRGGPALSRPSQRDLHCQCAMLPMWHGPLSLSQSPPQNTLPVSRACLRGLLALPAP